MLSMIVCTTNQFHVIGNNGKMLWHIPCDIAWFKFITDGKPIVMGRKTWESLPKKPLKNRKNIVLTRNEDFKAEGAKVICGEKDVLRFFKKHSVDTDEYIIIGGEKIYKLAFEYVDKIYYTEIYDVDRPIFGNERFIEDCRPGWRVFDKKFGFCWQGICTKYDEKLDMEINFFVAVKKPICFC